MELISPPPAPPDFAAMIRRLANRLIKKLDEHPDIRRKEATVQAVLINPVIELLGYRVSDPGQVRLQAGSSHTHLLLDYLLVAENGSQIAVEAKRSAGRFTKKQIGQLMGYLPFFKARVAMLSNGTRYSLFTQRVTETGMDVKPFREIDLHDLSRDDIDLLALLRRISLTRRPSPSLPSASGAGHRSAAGGRTRRRLPRMAS